MTRARRHRVAGGSGRGLRTGFTTGACAAAAARAAVRALLRGEPVSSIEIALPNGDRASFAVARCELAGGRARCGVVKDAGDDPDATHGAEIVAEVELSAPPGIALRGGEGVATVTKPGLGLELGAPAINPVPRRNIVENVLAELAGSGHPGALVTVSVPRGEEIARATLNPRLGLVGGISILGTSGIVRPFSTAAWEATVAQAIAVARAEGLRELVFTTGGRTEAFAMRLRPELPPLAFVQVGDGLGAALRHAAARGAERVLLVAMVGKLTKVAAGAMQTHASRSEVDLALLARVAADAGATPEAAAGIAAANTARHALDLCRREGLVPGVAARLCRMAAERCAAEEPRLAYGVALVDFDGAVLGRHPVGPEAGR